MTTLWRKLRSWPLWIRVVGGLLVAFMLGVGAGASSEQGEDPVVQARLADAEHRAEDAEEARDRAQERAAEQAAALEEREAELDELEAALDQREKKIRRTERQVERRIARNSIDDGIWQVGKDFAAGTYRAPGGGGCYWALPGSADTQDIINNGFGGANQTLTINSPWFETRDCGEWKKIG